jgi:hypothetical protein
MKNNLKEGFHKVEAENNKLILAYGEVTFHHHSMLLEKDNIELYRNVDGDMLLEIKDSPATLTHQEHSAIVLEPGCYEAYIQEEYDPEGMRRVVD